MRSIPSLVFISVVLGCLISSVGATPEADTIPNDFRLTAEFYPPYVPRYAEDYPAPWKIWYPWTVTITADGKAQEETDNSLGDQKKVIKKSFRVTQENLRQLVRGVQDSRFYLLEANYSYEVTDNPTLILRVTMNRKSHEVMVYAPDHLKQREEVAALVVSRLMWKIGNGVLPAPERT